MTACFLVKLEMTYSIKAIEKKTNASLKSRQGNLAHPQLWPIAPKLY
jgi:hypothetical protein